MDRRVARDPRRVELEHRIGAPEAVSGVVRFGVAEVVTTTWLPRLITVIAERYPNVRLEIEEALTAELDGLLGKLQPKEQREIRLNAAILLFRSDVGSMYATRKQQQLDELALELARYAITGSIAPHKGE